MYVSRQFEPKQKSTNVLSFETIQATDRFHDLLPHFHSDKLKTGAPRISCPKTWLYEQHTP